MAPLSRCLDRATEVITHRLQGVRGPKTLEQLRGRGYAAQLEPADICLECFLNYELDPHADEPVGGEGRAALGRILQPEDESAAELREAVAITVTSSYLTMLGLESPVGSGFVEGRDAEALWRWWVDHLRLTAPLAYGIPGQFGGSVRREGGEYLEAEIERLDLMPGMLRRRGLSERCGLISVSGLLLRLGQTDGIDDADLVLAQNSQKAAIWPLRPTA